MYEIVVQFPYIICNIGQLEITSLKDYSPEILSKKTLRITGMQGKNKYGDPIFLLHFFNVLCTVINCAKFEKKLSSTSFSRELP